MKITDKIVEKRHYKFVIDFEDGFNPFVINQTSFNTLSVKCNPYDIIQTCFNTPHKTVLTEDMLYDIDNEYQKFMAEAYALNGYKYKKVKVNFKEETFAEMRQRVVNEISSHKDGKKFLEQYM